MKKIITFSLTYLTLLLISCSKEDVSRGTSNTPPEYLGRYISTDLDTAYVTQIEGDTVYTKIRWCDGVSSGTISFDSVIVANDNSYTISQTLYYSSNYRPVIGTGSFGTNTTTFHFVIDGYMHVQFTGVKKP